MKNSILNEEHLIEKCKANNRFAQEALFNNYYPDLYRIAMRYLSDHYEAEDAIVIAFSKVYKQLSNFKLEGKDSLGRWIRTILIHEAIRILQKRRKLHFSDNLLQLNLQVTEANGLHKMQAADIQKMIEKLPSGYRTVFNLYVIEGYTHKEIASLLKISENTSKTQLKKARTSLMNTIEKENNYGTY